MDRLVRDDRNTTVTQITTRYNQDLQNTISEHTTHRTLKQMGSSSRRPHRVPLRSDKNRTRRIQFTQTHQNWTIEECKNVAWSEESRFLLHSDVGSEFGVKNMMNKQCYLCPLTSSTSIVKFADDTVVLGLINNNDEATSLMRWRDSHHGARTTVSL